MIIVNALLMILFSLVIALLLGYALYQVLKWNDIEELDL